MIVGALVFVIAALLVERGLAERRHESERKRILNAIVARTPGEFVSLQRADVDPPKPKMRSEDDGQYEQIGLS